MAKRIPKRHFDKCYEPRETPKGGCSIVAKALCTGCGKELAVTISRTESMQKLVVTPEKCKEHPEQSIILWPVAGFGIEN